MTEVPLFGTRFRLLGGLAAAAVLGSCSDSGAGPSTPYPYDLLYVTGSFGNFDIHRIHLDGTGDTTLTSSIADDEEPATTPGDPRIVFVSHRTNQPELYLMNPDGSNQVPLTADTGNLDAGTLQPAWSLDGGRIVYTRLRYNPGNTPAHEIFSMNADGTGRVPLTPPSDTGGNIFPSYSADGSRIVFWRFPNDGASGIFIMNANGSNMTRLTGDPHGDTDPCWNTAGTQIVFVRTGDDTVPPDFHHTNLWIMNADGSDQHRLLSTGAVSDSMVTCRWSPDGQKIAVVHGNKVAVVNVADHSVHDIIQGIEPAWIPRETAARH